VEVVRRRERLRGRLGMNPAVAVAVVRDRELSLPSSGRFAPAAVHMAPRRPTRGRGQEARSHASPGASGRVLIVWPDRVDVAEDRTADPQRASSQSSEVNDGSPNKHDESVRRMLRGDGNGRHACRGRPRATSASCPSIHPTPAPAPPLGRRDAETREAEVLLRRLERQSTLGRSGSRQSLTVEVSPGARFVSVQCRR